MCEYSILYHTIDLDIPNIPYISPNHHFRVLFNPSQVSVVKRDRRSTSAVLEVVLLSICLSVRLSHACFVTKSNNELRIFLYDTKKQSLQFLTPTVVGGRCPGLLSEICAQSDPPLQKAPTSTDVRL